MITIDDVKELLSVGSKIREAIEATDVVKKRMRARLKDCSSMLQVLLQSGSPDAFKSELKGLRDIYDEIEALHVKHTAGPEDPRWVRWAKRVNRGTQHESIEQDLDAIDGQALQVFTAVAAKSSIGNSKAIRQILQDLKLKGRGVRGGSNLLVAGGVFGAVFVVLAALMLAPRDGEPPVDVLKAIELILHDLGPDGVYVSDRTQLLIVGLFGTLLVVFGAVMTAQRNAVFSMIRKTLPPSLPEKAAVPAGALALPDSYVERPCVREAADGLINQETALAPYMVVGMGGSGKTVLANAIVRESSVREHFRGGIFWVSVGREAKRSLLPLLQTLAREMSAAPTDAPHGVPHVLDSLERVKQHLAAVASTGNSPRLVVLDDVWEREVVDAFLLLKLKVLLTTRDHSVVGVPGGRLEVGDMTEEESLELLQKTSLVACRPGVDVRAQMTEVIALCGHLPLVLAIAGSMPIVKGHGLTAGAWEKLVTELKNVAKKIRARGEQATSLKLVLETSFNALSPRKQEEFLKMAVMAMGAVAPIDMLLNLWEIKDVNDTREEADGLVSKCLLQGVGNDGYRVHDLVLEFMKLNVKADTEMVKKATALQAQYLNRLDVVERCEDPKHGAGHQGLYFLDALWRSVEELSGDPGLEVDSYRASLEELESYGAPEGVMAKSYARVGFLLFIQAKYAEAERVLERSQVIWEKLLDPEHPTLASLLNNRAAILGHQGRYADAEQLFQRCQAIEEKVLGPEHSRVAATLNNRANFLKNQGKYNEAEPLFSRAIVIGEKASGPDSLLVATILNSWAALLRAQAKYAEAEPLYERCQAIMEKVLAPEHPALAKTLNNRALLLASQGKHDEAEPLYIRAIANGEKTLGPDHPDVAVWFINLAKVRECQGKYDEAESLYTRAIAIGEKKLGPDHPTLAVWLGHRAASLHAQHKYAEAKPLYERCQAIEEKVRAPEHPGLAITLYNRAYMFENQAKYAEAEPLYERCQAIQEKVLAPEHPRLAITLYKRAYMFENQGKYDEAEPLFIRAIAIAEKVQNPDDPELAMMFITRATSLLRQGKGYNEVIPLLERALSNFKKSVGESNSLTIDTRNHLECAREKVREQR